MATPNLNNTEESILTGNDSIVIVDNFQSIRGGRSLDTTDFTPEVIQAGHVIIKETATDEYKPMPVTGVGAITALGAITGGSLYAVDGVYTDVDLTGGSGSGATANITVAGGIVTAVALVSPGTGYAADDELSASAADIGGTGSGFKVVVASVGTEATDYDSLPGSHEYAGILINTILTAKPFAGIMVRGTVNPAAAPFPMDTILSAVKTALPLIDFRED